MEPSLPRDAVPGPAAFAIRSSRCMTLGLRGIDLERHRVGVDRLFAATLPTKNVAENLPRVGVATIDADRLLRERTCFDGPIAQKRGAGLARQTR